MLQACAGSSAAAGSQRRRASGRPEDAAVSQQLFLHLLALGLLTSVTPWGIVAVIVLLGAKTGPRGAIAFVAGWVTSILLIGVLIIGLYKGTHTTPGESAGNAMLGVQLTLGVLLLALATRKWRGRTPADPTAAEPKWLEALDRMRPIVAFGFGMFWVNLVFVVDAALAVAQAELSHTDAVLAYLFYAALATLGVAAILAVYYSNRKRAEQRLTAMRAWLTRNNTGIVSGVIGVIGLVFIIRGLIGLLD